MNLNEILIHPRRYAYVKTMEIPKVDHIKVSKDYGEFTIIVEDKNLSKIDSTKEIKWFTMFEIRSLFSKKKNLDKVVKTLNDEDIQALIISKKTRSYILVSDKIHEEALQVLTREKFVLTPL